MTDLTEKVKIMALPAPAVFIIIGLFVLLALGMFVSTEAALALILFAIILWIVC